MEEENTLIEQLSYLAETKQHIKEAIEEKGQSISDNDTFRIYATKIENIDTVNAQIKEVTPQVYAQSILPDENYNAISEVIVNAVTSEVDENIKPENIKVGTTILGTAGTYTSDANAISGDIWKNTAYVNGEKLTGTLQVTQNVTRKELDSKIDMWNTFTNFSTVGNNLSYLFSNLSQKLLPTITANDVVDISGMYYNCRNLIEVDITKLNTLNTTNMDNTFSNCSNLTNLNLNSWKSNNLQSTKGMFDNCMNLTSIDVTNWNVTNLKDTTSMFENCKNLTNLNVSRWNTYNVEIMPKMFKNCQHMENLSFTNWNTANVSNMEAIFESCDRFTNESIANVVNMLPDATQLTNNNAFNLGIDMDRYTSEQLVKLANKHYVGVPLPFNMYYNIVNLDDGSYYLLNKGDDLDKNASKLKNYISNEYNNGLYNISIEDNRYKEGTLTSLYSFVSGRLNYRNIDLDGLNTSNVLNMSYMFEYCYNLTNIDVSNWNTSNVLNMSYMFENCRNLTNIDVSNWNTSNVLNMLYMFENCRNLTNIDVSNWDTSNVSNMGNMFCRCYNLTNIDVSNWGTSKVASMYGMFYGCLNLIDINVSSWDTGNVSTMSSMFEYCYNLTNIDVSNWNTNNVLNMSNMFESCYNLTNIDVSNWNTSNVLNMSYMFYQCYNLTNINVSSWNIAKVTNIAYMCSFCNNLSNESIDSIINMCLNATNISRKNLSIKNYGSPFYGSNITNDRYQNRWAELDAVGWTY